MGIRSLTWTGLARSRTCRKWERPQVPASEEIGSQAFLGGRVTKLGTFLGHLPYHDDYSTLRSPMGTTYFRADALRGGLLMETNH